MAAKKKKPTVAKKKKTGVDYTPTSQDELYVSMADPQTKRREILEGIKSSLIMQEEHEKVIAIRKEKARILLEIKRSMAKLNRQYQQLKTQLPNVKNVISNTEKEFMHLDSHIGMLSTDIDANKEKISTDKSLKRSLKPSKDIPAVVKGKKETVKHEKSNSDMDSMDRIKNNLKVIESKLKKV